MVVNGDGGGEGGGDGGGGEDELAVTHMRGKAVGTRIPVVLLMSVQSSLCAWFPGYLHAATTFVCVCVCVCVCLKLFHRSADKNA